MKACHLQFTNAAQISAAWVEQEVVAVLFCGSPRWGWPTAVWVGKCMQYQPVMLGAGCASVLNFNYIAVAC
jgi:hypothetical protein